MPCPFLTHSNPHARRYMAPFNGHMVTNTDMHSVEIAKKILCARTDTNKTELNKMFADTRARLQNLLPKCQDHDHHHAVPHETIVHVALGRKNLWISTCLKIMGFESMGDDFLYFQIVADARAFPRIQGQEHGDC
jgi:hypothetical protein